MKSMTQSPIGGNATATLVANASTSEALLITGGIRTVALGMTITAGSGKVEYTLSSVEDVDSGAAIWRTWPAGVVTEDTEDALLTPVTAIRLVSISGAIILEVVGA